MEIDGGGVSPREPHDALLVDDDDRSRERPAGIVEEPVLLGHVAVGMVVGQDRVRDASQRGRVSLVGRPRVCAYTQNLGILLLERLVVLAERGDLVRSAAGERELVGREDHVPVALELADADDLLALVLQLEVGCGLPCGDHVLPPGE